MRPPSPCPDDLPVPAHRCAGTGSSPAHHTPSGSANGVPDRAPPRGLDPRPGLDGFPSFGNNCNHRAEEAIGNAADLWTAVG
ncbi:MAG: PaeR7I family type II restriction endonuclease [Microthrixaceae bacterium]